METDNLKLIFDPGSNQDQNKNSDQLCYSQILNNYSLQNDFLKKMLKFLENQCIHVEDISKTLILIGII